MNTVSVSNMLGNSLFFYFFSGGGDGGSGLRIMFSFLSSGTKLLLFLSFLEEFLTLKWFKFKETSPWSDEAGHPNIVAVP